ncbi:protein FAM204A-like [Mercenaria mercenaria]|uniref:protein FAM204A-like n=1 Tax=Mercenaria mercenaria TaxID=6596 RepID=UPI00234F07A1|nr:protein FAM204A-like [Mercenaria mercenaria]XP_045188874.2 protein FAM204A-like [Mercenaria mercenaria]
MDSPVIAEIDEKKSKPKCISSKTWERFQAIQKRTDEVTKRSTEKRIKHLQKTILQNVTDELRSEEDRAVLREYDVQLPTESKQQQPNTLSSDESSDKFKEVEKYLGVNSHLQDGVSTDGAPKSGLEKQIEDAITAGDMVRAESLSDKLATRDFGVKISEAVTARDYMKRKKDEDEKIKSKKKKKLNWGFEHKQRWETKSNM